MPSIPRSPRSYPGLGSLDPKVASALQLRDDRLFQLRDATTPLRGRLAPDERPAELSLGDAGLLYYSIDFDRVLRWNGTGWEDAPGSSSRGQVGFFTNDPGPGWLRCDGRAGQATQTDGTVYSLKAPGIDILNGLLPFLRV